MMMSDKKNPYLAILVCVFREVKWNNKRIKQTVTFWRMLLNSGEFQT